MFFKLLVDDHMPANDDDDDGGVISKHII